MPFLTIVTRCCKRPHMLTLNVQSVLAQTDYDLEQVFIVDYNQVGVLAANRSLALNRHRVEGDYVYILDDDTRLLNKVFVARLRLTAKGTPDVIMVKSSRPQFAPHVLPKPLVWNCPDRMTLGSTNCLCYVVRRQMWLDHIEAFGEPAAGDWWFLSRLRSRGATFAWIDLIVAGTQQLGRGKLFEQCDKDWFRQVTRKWGFQELELGDWRLSLYAHPKPRTFWKTKPGKVIQRGKPSLEAIMLEAKQEPRPKSQRTNKPKTPKVVEVIEVISVEHNVYRPRVAHSLLSRRRKRE